VGPALADVFVDERRGAVGGLGGPLGGECGLEASADQRQRGEDLARIEQVEGRAGEIVDVRAQGVREGELLLVELPLAGPDERGVGSGVPSGEEAAGHGGHALLLVVIHRA